MVERHYVCDECGCFGQRGYGEPCPNCENQMRYSAPEIENDRLREILREIIGIDCSLAISHGIECPAKQKAKKELKE